jgi:Ca2+-binding RTX toxin-like protein
MITGPSEVLPGERPAEQFTNYFESFNFTLQASDTDLAAEAAGFDFLIDWGDGTAPTFIPATPGNGTGVEVSHAFVGDFGDPLNIQLTATSSAGSALASHDVTIAPVLELDGAVFIAGTNDDDTISVTTIPFGSSHIEVARNGDDYTFTNSGFAIIVLGQGGTDEIDSIATISRIYGSDGPDNIIVNSVGFGSNTETNTGLGDDTVIVLTTDKGNLAMADRVFGGGGDDDITVDCAAADNNTNAPGFYLDGEDGSDSYTLNYNDLVFVPLFRKLGDINDSGTTGSDSLVTNGTAGDDEIIKTAGSIRKKFLTAGQPSWIANSDYIGMESVTIYGHGGNDHIVDPGSDTTLLGGPGNDTIVIDGTTGTGVTADGGEDADNIIVKLGNLDGPVNVLDSGTTGADTLVIEGTTAADQIDVVASAVMYGTETIQYSASVDSLALNGGNGDDTINVLATDVSALSINGEGGVDSINVQLENVSAEVTLEEPGSTIVLNGTAASDAMLFRPRGNDGEIEVFLNGSSRSRITPTGPVIVHGGDGDDDISVSNSIDASFWLYGDSGNDRVGGGAGHDVLFGGSGDDLVAGGGGRDFLVGGEGADQIVGNADDDILVAGILLYESNETAIDRIMREWTANDTYANRTAHLSGATGGLNEAYYLVTDGPSANVLDDNDNDVLTGSSGDDWFFANLFLGNGDDASQKDKITDLHASEFALDLDFIGVL